MIPANERRVKRGWMNLKVTKVIDDTHDTKTFEFVDADEGGRPWDYEAGQYLTFRYDGVAEKPLVRSYTMSSSPNQGDYSAVTVKRVEKGVISNWMCDTIQVGTILRARGPIGRFCFEAPKDKDHLVMVAAGSGVTPFVSIMRQYADKLGKEHCPKKMSLLVSYRTDEDLILWKDLQDFKKLGLNVVVTLTRSVREGFLNRRIDKSLMKDFITWDPSSATYMTCGPDSMMAMVKEYLLAANVAESQIKLESFSS